ncbi:MAG TPA: EAL domain-containing protein [Thermoanaerobaculia bacterium]|jgi:diguanylate cyclase (GGDEF)-like protein|nr:EAL domain-containing protein [Thermoanaerobaculia bacterium]
MVTLDTQIVTLVDRTGSLVWSTDAQLRVTAVRGAALRTSGLDVAQMVSSTIAAHQSALRGQPVDLECEISDRVYELHIAPARDAGGAIAGCVGIAFDTTARRRIEQTMVWQSSHDALTRLPNRSALREKLTHAVRDARRGVRPLALIVLDVDGMHCINDAAGQDAGDELLTSIGARIVAAAGPLNFTARISGDSFAIVLASGWPVPIAAAITHSLETPFVVGDRDVLVTVSMGIAEFPHHGDSADHLMRAAEAALRRAIELGGNRYQFSSADLTIAAAERLGLDTRLRCAIERGELSLAYQPQVRLQDGALFGVEALLRWYRDGELIPAAAFIRSAEESSVIIDIGEWVVDEACRQLRAWCNAGIAPPRLALNIGARHFQHPGFFGTIRRAIERHGIDGRMLEIEITETTAMHNAEATAQLIDELRELGVEITIDDFGTGYSSLAYLKRFAITGLKIDRSFVHDLPSSRSAGAIVNAILATAHALDLRVVAEGVEQSEQAGFLTAAGCDEAQGYWFGLPMNVEAIEAHLRACAKLSE